MRLFRILNSLAMCFLYEYFIMFVYIPQSDVYQQVAGFFLGGCYFQFTKHPSQSKVQRCWTYCFCPILCLIESLRWVEDVL